MKLVIICSCSEYSSYYPRLSEIYYCIIVEISKVFFKVCPRRVSSCVHVFL